MKEYRAGHLSKVQRLDGNPAFDPELLAGMVSLEKLASLGADESESVRQLVATVLSRSADPNYTETLIRLVRDPPCIRYFLKTCPARQAEAGRKGSQPIASRSKSSSTSSGDA